MTQNLRKGFSKLRNAIMADPALTFLHIGTATGLAGFCLSDPLPLRACSITSSVASITFALTRNPILSYVPVYWSSLYIMVNVYKIVELVMERKPIEMTELEEDVYAKHFMKSGMRPRQFKRLAKAARIKEFEPESLIEEEGSRASMNTVKLIMSGTVTVFKSNEEVFTVDSTKPICFLGDLSLLEMADASASPGDVNVKQLVPSFTSTAVAGKERVVVMEWDKEFLLEVLKQPSELSQRLRSVLTNSVMQKVIDMGSLNTKAKYVTLLSAFAADGNINSLEKRVLIQYAKSHGISAATHEDCLSLIGWSVDEYNRGFKHGYGEYTLPKAWKSLQKKIQHAIDPKQKEELEEMLASGALKLSAPVTATKSTD